jgi:hypothetical protein
MTERETAQEVKCSRTSLAKSAALIATIATVLLLAGVVGARGENSGRTNVASLDVFREGNILARFTNFPSHECAPTGSWASSYFKVSGPSPTPSEKMLYSQLLSARLAERVVYVGTEGCEGEFEVVTFVGLFY